MVKGQGIKRRQKSGINFFLLYESLFREIKPEKFAIGELNQFSSVAQSYPTLCDPMDYITPGFPVHHQLLELVQTHVRRVSDAIQPSHPLLSPSPPTFN